MVREVDPAQTSRGQAFALWNKAPMPMVTIFKTLDVTPLVRYSRRKGYKFNMLLCWCIGKAAARTPEFYLLPVGDRLLQYDRLAVNTIAATDAGGIASCDIAFSEDLDDFNRDYLACTGRARQTGEGKDLSAAHMVIGTSALAAYEIDGLVNLYAGVYNNPFLHWGKYRRKLLRRLLPVSFQFHHAQMDGVPAARFLDQLQREIFRLGRS